MADRITIGSDHAGFDVKQGIVELLKERGLDVVDAGPDSKDSVDYPDFADKLAHAIADGQSNTGILVCGTGIGISIVANRHRHILGDESDGAQALDHGHPLTARRTMRAGLASDEISRIVWWRVDPRE